MTKAEQLKKLRRGLDRACMIGDYDAIKAFERSIKALEGGAE